MTPRVIPCLLLSDQGLVKTRKFKDPRYVGDPINALRIFNEKEVDEIVFLDIVATVRRKAPSFETIKQIASECFMPLGYGGGVRSIEDVKRVFSLGVEKVVLNTVAFENPVVVEDTAETFGSQSVVVSIDVKRHLLGGPEVLVRSGTTRTKTDPVTYARQAVEMGAGEILLNSIDRDGTRCGYDLELIRSVAEAVSIPVVACGGAGSTAHLSDAITRGYASAVAAGSMFVFHGKHNAVLITYPGREELEQAFAIKEP